MMNRDVMRLLLLAAFTVALKAEESPNNGTAPEPAAAPQTMCERCARAPNPTARDSPCFYASSASNNVNVQHKFCDSKPVGSGTQFACCPVQANGYSYDCGKDFGRCSCVGAGCAVSYTQSEEKEEEEEEEVEGVHELERSGMEDAEEQESKGPMPRENNGGGSLLGVLVPVILIISIISCCVSYRRNQQANYYGQELSPMPPAYGGQPNAPGYGGGYSQQGGYPMGGQPMYQQNQNQGMGAGTGAALGGAAGLMGGMMIANAMHGGHHHHDGGYGGGGGGGAQQQDAGGQDMGADMGFGE
mmetsp:Transcript_38793/g.62517  ORF Transcript_38793/g.62517 Transcript_38793/m.62517 type:complete len:301 (-) Transcript_38793:685-1587(-)